MSFPTASTLTDVRGLAAWLMERAWVDEMASNSLQRMRQIRVDEIRRKLDYPPVLCEFGDPELMVECRSIDQGRHVCITQLAFFEDYDRRTRKTSVDFIAYCTCGQHIECPHTIAIFEKLREIITGGKAEPPSLTVVRHDIKNWLGELKRAVEQSEKPEAKPASTYNKFLAYCLEPDPRFYHSSSRQLCLVPRVGNRKKSGTTIEKSIAQPDLTRMPKYMTREDIPIIAGLTKWKRETQSWSATSRISGSGWDDILDPALETGRLYAATTEEAYESGAPSHIPLEAGPEVTVDVAWEKLPDGTSKPVLHLPNEEIELLPTEPMRYVDRTRGHLGIVNSHLPANLLRAWPMGPAVPNEALSELGQALVKFSTNTPLPVPEDKPPTVIKGLAPQPVLHITEVRVGIYQKRHIGGLVRFRYQDQELHPLAEGAPATASWYEKDARFVLERDAAAESKFAKSLTDHSLTPLHQLFAPSDLNEKTRHSVVIGEPSMELRTWLEFLDSPTAHALCDAGWLIEPDPKLNLTVHDIGDFFPEIDEDSEHGIDWFRFDVTGEFDGKKISLIPHIAHAIREDWPALYADPEARPESLLLPCDNPEDGHIRFPAQRFLEIVDQVRHLFHGTGKPDGPLRMDRLLAAGVADALGVDASETTRALAALGKSLRDIHGVPAVELPATILADLRPYQVDGFRWLQFLARNSLHGILADDMGLGKTLQTLTHLAAEKAHAAGRPSLVIAPTSVVPNWAAEAEKFAPTLKTLVLHGSERGDHFELIPDHDIVFTTYPLLARDFDILRKTDWHAIVLDEAQYIKNPKAISSQCACKLRAVHRICLSGTPMENHLGELWSLMRFLMPGFLSDEKTFNSFIRKPIERDRSRDAQIALNRRVSPLILRRTKDQVATELPEKTTLVHRIDLEGKQTDLYESVRAAMDMRVREALEDKGLAKSHIIVLDALLKLRQICCHPQLLKSESARRCTESAKLEYLSQELLPTLLEEGRKILLFSQFTSMLALIEEHLQLEKIPYLKLTGQTKERAKLVKQFQAGEVPVFLISLKAGGTGLNLTAADTVIHYDPWWNPAAENQATDRAHRIGQQKPVFVHKLVCTGTIEERILELQQHKAALVKALLSDETTKLKIDADTLSHLFSPIG